MVDTGCINGSEKQSIKNMLNRNVEPGLLAIGVVVRGVPEVCQGWSRLDYGVSRSEFIIQCSM